MSNNLSPSMVGACLRLFSFSVQFFRTVKPFHDAPQPLFKIIAVYKYGLKR
jgi:hypothetical protein